MTRPRRLTSTLAFLATIAFASAAPDALPFHRWAAKPPMGWNSWDCFATTVTEAQTKAHTDIMADKLARHGWEYIVVDIQWYEPGATGYNYRKGAPVVLDDYGRLLPAANKFPSAADGSGFKPLADYVHAKGLKFGIHLMRGIPRQAVEKNLPILGTTHRAADIADTVNVCPWNADMYGVDMSKPGAQEYYDSVFALIASWGVDFVKVDDLSRPYLRNQPEVEAVRKAIDKTGRPMVLSLSPGETDLKGGAHVMQHANLWRISDDFWDKWPELLAQFKRLHDWTPYRTAGAWPDADMLPLGIIEMGRPTRFTRDEQVLLMTLWSIARSPLMHGGDMTKMDEFTLTLLTNDEVLAVNQNSTNNRQLHRAADGRIAWVADVPGSADKYVALFNTRSAAGDASGAQRVSVTLADLGFGGEVVVRDLWSHQDLGTFSGEFGAILPPHGAGLYRLSAR
ncbi:MAG TPA: glycoside hydrolase family 27 protein [Opitutaceae bacterium]